MDAKQTPAQMLGEFVREAAVLIAVLAPLDMSLQRIPFTPLNIVATLGAVGFLLTLGILIEVVRQ
jgi:hypothetical protein